MATRGARAAAGKAADHRVPGHDHAFSLEPMGRRFCPTIARLRLDRGSHHRGRVSLGGGTRRAVRRDRCRARPAESGRHCHVGNRTPRGKAGDISHPNRVRRGERPGWQRLCRKSVATGRQHHWPIAPVDRSCWQTPRTVPRGCPRPPPVGDHGAVLELAEVQAAARALGLEVATLEIRRAEDIAPAFEALNGRADALYIETDALIFTHRIRINTLALAARLPTMHSVRAYVEAGGLMSYGPNYTDLFRRAGELVDKILRGAKPADIPVEQPTKFDLVINLTTAKALRLSIPPGVLALADEVIE